ncbi:ATP-binding protein [Altericista sp. CCNU0014]|uniref:sensor histidine kinase n=1 Tax=Altericista sp. CCNU0014 TaxID=3082949 RepID=UPI00384BEA7C
MLMPASSEFITLCRTQVALLIDGFGASLSAIYLTEDPTAENETALVPLVIFPEENSQRSGSAPLALPRAVGDLSARSQDKRSPRTLRAAARRKLSGLKRSPASTGQLTRSQEREPTRLVLPLIHENMMWGLLVVGREERRWLKREQAQLEQIAHTLAIACVLDQRSQWLAQGHDLRMLQQAQQHTALSTLLHQFRNPLTTLRTLGKLLLKRLQPEDANRALAESLVGESDRLESLLRQFDDAIDLGDAALEPDLESLESKEIPPSSPLALMPGPNWLTGGALTLQPCWLGDILLPSIHAIAGRVDERDVRLHVTIPDELPPIKADAAALREVFGNLLDNALKYSPAGAEIWVDLERDADRLIQRVSISDSGCGIPAGDLERIFERSYRGVQAQTAIPGTGLGLAIARDLIAQMGGKIQAFSPAIVPGGLETANSGSTFIVQLPEYSE